MTERPIVWPEGIGFEEYKALVLGERRHTFAELYMNQPIVDPDPQPRPSSPAPLQGKQERYEPVEIYWYMTPLKALGLREALIMVHGGLHSYF